jgi:hypothetical protein
MDEKNTETNGDGAMDEKFRTELLHDALDGGEGLTTERLWAGVRETAQWIDARAASAEAGDLEQEEAEWAVCTALDSLRWWMHYFDKTEHREPEEEEEA